MTGTKPEREQKTNAGQKTNAAQRTGVIVAGGRSTRFGDADKAVAELAGVPLVRRVADRLVEVCDALVVNCRADQREAIEGALAGLAVPVRFAVDRETDRGPVAGIERGLRVVESDYAGVVACDMPFVDPAFLSYLFDRAVGHDAAVPRVERWFEPMQAVYRVAAMGDACHAALAEADEREPRVIDPLADLDTVVVEGDELERHAAAETFDNVNTVAALREAAARLRE